MRESLSAFAYPRLAALVTRSEDPPCGDLQGGCGSSDRRTTLGFPALARAGLLGAATTSSARSAGSSNRRRAGGIGEIPILRTSDDARIIRARPSGHPHRADPVRQLALGPGSRRRDALRVPARRDGSPLASTPCPCWQGSRSGKSRRGGPLARPLETAAATSNVVMSGGPQRGHHRLVAAGDSRPRDPRTARTPVPHQGRHGCSSSHTLTSPGSRPDAAAKCPCVRSQTRRSPGPISMDAAAADDGLCIAAGEVSIRRAGFRVPRQRLWDGDRPSVPAGPDDKVGRHGALALDVDDAAGLADVGVLDEQPG